MCVVYVDDTSINLLKCWWAGGRLESVKVILLKIFSYKAKKKCQPLKKKKTNSFSNGKGKQKSVPSKDATGFRKSEKIIYLTVK